MKGNISRFINHSCNPSCVLQKWVVNSRLRMGIFATRDIAEGEELTFDYKFERYGYFLTPFQIHMYLFQIESTKMLLW